MIIALSGEAGSGKSTVARFLAREHGFQELSFAGRLKECIGRGVFGLHDEQLYGKFKEVVDPRYDKSPREILQLGGEYMRRIQHDIWIRAALRDIDMDAKYVISDARYLNELKVVKEGFGGETWLISRQGAGAQNGIAGHASETEFKLWTFDRVILNDESLDELHSAVNEIVNLEGACI